jgi:glycosyltransferase involved in cell wall biosynthesis
VGRLLPTKGVGMLLEAVARVKGSIRVALTIVGDGPSRAHLESESARLGVNGCATFTGELPLPEVARRMQVSHVLCLPSVRESGGAVLLEAAACGLPAITVNLGGPGELVDDAVGRALPGDGAEQLTRDLAETLLDVVQNPREWRERGANALRRAEERYAWEAKLDRAMEIYRSVLNREPVHG